MDRNQHRRVLIPGSTLFDEDAQLLFDRMAVTPDTQRKYHIDRLITTLKNDGNWDKLDVLVILAASDSQSSLLDWKDLQDGALVNAPTFESDRGFTGDGSTSYVNTQFNPSSDAVNYLQDDASHGVYTRTNSSVNPNDMGLIDASSDGGRIIARSLSGTLFFQINSDTSPSSAVADSLGLHTATRSANNLQEGFKNGASVATGADTSEARLDGEFYVLCRNRLGTGAEQFSVRQGAAYFFSAGTINQLTLFTAIEAYMDAIGAGVA